VSVSPITAYFKPISHTRVIQLLLEEFSKCFESEKSNYKQKELLVLAEMLHE
jgi:hypothetical protein